MDPDGDKKIKNSKREKSENSFLKRFDVNVSTIFQSIRIRCCSIFPTITNREFMEGELRVVLYCGVLFWLLYLLYEVIK